MLWFLAATSTAYLLLGQPVEGIVLLLALLPLLGMDALLHYRTAASTESLSARLASRATVERDGTVTEVTASELVPGDLVLVAAGEWFPADGLIVSGERDAGRRVVADGRIVPGGRSSRWPQAPRRRSGDVMLPELHWGFAGTRLLTGEARQRVLWTGGETLYGEIVRSAVGGMGQRTPLQEAIANLVRGLVVGAAAMCLVLAYVRLRQGFGWLDALLSGADARGGGATRGVSRRLHLVSRRRRVPSGAAQGAGAPRRIGGEHRPHHLHLLGQDRHHHRGPPRSHPSSPGGRK